MVAGTLMHEKAEADGRQAWMTSTPEQHARGAAGELAVAKWLGVFWMPGYEPDRVTGDINLGGNPLQVKTTTRSNGSLYVKPHDPIEHRYVLAYPAGRGRVILLGWARGREAKNDEFYVQQEWPVFKYPGRRLHEMKDMIL
jgi:hypothetical protein